MLSEVRFEGVHKIFGTENAVEDLNLTVNAGRLQQVDAPETLYDNPANLFVAGFIGSPAVEFVPGKLAAANGMLPGALLGLTAPPSTGARLIVGPAYPEVTCGLPRLDLVW